MSYMSQHRMPAFSAGGRPTIGPDQWRLTVDGMVATEREFDLEDIRAMPQSEVDARLTSVSGFSLRARWQGVLWRDFLAGLEPEPGASHATFTSQGGGYTTTVSLKDLDHPRVMLVLGVEDEPLETDFGGPLRMLVPHLWGYKSAKWLAGVTFGDKMQGGFWEDRGYTREGIIEPGVTLDLNSGQRRAIRGGEVTEF
ncbi:MAG: molybdopterin-dependent oxidoreductase [Proteobacteria bacterium]|nr:molybdopterin-dependent oxidoreductase [Pseudomonadota bacterium]MBU4382357.1 molybdopterin-dependent oxidoreductase [Pseudomonadota bacterium]MCG2766021.1 molybdopterin-dependent oxidoreductase [Desulfarculaceae bacterium]